MNLGSALSPITYFFVALALAAGFLGLLIVLATVAGERLDQDTAREGLEQEGAFQTAADEITPATQKALRREEQEHAAVLSTVGQVSLAAYAADPKVRSAVDALAAGLPPREYRAEDLERIVLAAESSLDRKPVPARASRLLAILRILTLPLTFPFRVLTRTGPPDERDRHEPPQGRAGA